MDGSALGVRWGPVRVQGGAGYLRPSNEAAGGAQFGDRAAGIAEVKRCHAGANSQWRRATSFSGLCGRGGLRTGGMAGVSFYELWSHVCLSGKYSFPFISMLIVFTVKSHQNHYPLTALSCKGAFRKSAKYLFPLFFAVKPEERHY